MKRKQNDARLRLWQKRAEDNKAAYQPELNRMDRREELYNGDKSIKKPLGKGAPKKTTHVRNICAEMVESCVNSNIPMPKVTALRPQDEGLAKIIEDMIRNELNRMPFEMMNDLMERMVRIQGGGLWLVEWDSSKRTHTTVGEVAVQTLHPKQVIPQDGITDDIERMDYIIVEIPQTKSYIKARYGVDVGRESEENPWIRGAGEETTADDIVTQVVAYYRNLDGGIGIYSWAGDTELEDLEDYQARRLRRCKQCGVAEPAEPRPMEEQTFDGNIPGGVPGEPLGEEVPEAGAKPRPGGGSRKTCPYCGGTAWEDAGEDFEEVWSPISLRDGRVIPGAHPVEEAAEEVLDENGLPVTRMVLEPTRIPYYKPGVYPVILQRNVSQYGRFLGASDMDKLEDVQNTANQLSQKIQSKLMEGGSIVTLPQMAHVELNAEQMRVLRLKSPADKALIDVITVEADVGQDLAYRAEIYEEGRQALGVTDSFQGRKDATATSGKAKEFSAAQAAGRMESNRVMRNAAFARLFEVIFKFKLAYADEPRTVVSTDVHGQTQYGTFNRYDFLEQDAAGEWYWNDRFLFSVDTTAPLAGNREAMWQETRSHFESGAFGNPQEIDTQILYWTKMEMLHYPGAGDTKTYLQEKQQRRQQEQAMMLKQQMAMQNQTTQDSAAAQVGTAV